MTLAQSDDGQASRGTPILHTQNAMRRVLRPSLAFIGIGSNHDAERQVARAVEALAQRTSIHAISTFYRTPAARETSAGWFCNGVVVVRTRRPAPWLVARVLKPLERRLGRNRLAGNGNQVAIDLDLLLTTPTDGTGRPGHQHPAIRTWAYVAVPLLEVAGDIRLDGESDNLAGHVSRLADANMVRLDRLTDRIRRRHRLDAEAAT